MQSVPVDAAIEAEAAATGDMYRGGHGGVGTWHLAIECALCGLQ